MARQTQGPELDKIPILLNDLILMREAEFCEKDQVLTEIVRSCLQRKKNMTLPVLITVEERGEISNDRQKAVELEEKLQRKRQERYSSLVDQVQNILRRIEEKKSSKQSIPETMSPEINLRNGHPSINSETLVSSDLNNNPAVRDNERPSPLTSNNIKNQEFGQNNHTRVTLDFSDQQTPEQSQSRKAGKSTRYSLPADFAPGIHFRNHSRHDSPSQSITNSQGKPSRPVSSFSDHPSLYSTTLHLSDTTNSSISTLRNSPSTALPTTTTTTNTLPHAMSTATSTCHSPVPHGNWSTTLSSSNATETLSTMPLKNLDQSNVTNQKQLFAFEQKRLEDHYNVLQAQLVAQFQQQQNELLQSYKESVEVSSLVSGTQDFGLLTGTESRTASYSETPKQAYNGYNGELSSIRGESFSAPISEDRRTFPVNNSTPNTHERMATTAAAVVETPPNKDTSSKADDYQVVETDEFPQSPFSLSPKRTRSAPRLQTASPTSVTIKSFTSEASVQEFYELPRRVAEKEMERGKQDGVKGLTERNYSNRKDVRTTTMTVQSPTTASERKSGSFGVDWCTSPKLTKLNSFEAKTTESKLVQNHKFMMISAHAKGFLTRRLFQTGKVIGYVTTIKDAKVVLNELKTETSQSMTDRSLTGRVEAQLHCAQDELRKIFVDPSPHLRMHILEQNRKLLKEKEDRNKSKVPAKSGSQTRPRLSSVTMKKRHSRQEKDTRKTTKSSSVATPSPTSTAAIKTTVVSKHTPSPKRVEKPRDVRKPSTTTGVSTKSANGSASRSHVTTTTTTTASANAGSEVRKVVSTRTSGRVTKQTSKVVSAQTKKRRTWDQMNLKPIQGRISPTLPSKTKSSEEKPTVSTNSSSAATTTKGADTKHSAGTQGTLGTYGNVKGTSRSSKPTTINNNSTKPKPVTRPGAKRSLAANLSVK